MRKEDIETVRRGYEAFNRGDLDWMVEHMDPAIVWEEALEVPGAQTYRGVDEVRRYLESLLHNWDEIRYEIEGLQEAPEAVVALVRLVARGKASGAEVDARMAHLHELRGGRGVRVHVYFDREAAWEAAGLKPDAAGGPAVASS